MQRGDVEHGEVGAVGLADDQRDFRTAQNYALATRCPEAVDHREVAQFGVRANDPAAGFVEDEPVGHRLVLRAGWNGIDPEKPGVTVDDVGSSHYRPGSEQADAPETLRLDGAGSRIDDVKQGDRIGATSLLA
jgi:hypothetical protein